MCSCWQSYVGARQTQSMPRANVDFTRQMIATFCQLIDSTDSACLSFDRENCRRDSSRRPRRSVRRPWSSATSDRSRGINATKYGVNARPAGRVVGLWNSTTMRSRCRRCFRRWAGSGFLLSGWCQKASRVYCPSASCHHCRKLAGQCFLLLSSVTGRRHCIADNAD